MSRKLKLLLLSFACLWAGMAGSPLQTQEQEKVLWAVDVGPEYTALGGDYDSLFLWSRNETKPDLRIPVAGTITNLKWHPDGETLAISTQWSVKAHGEGVMAFNPQNMDFQILEGISETGARAIDWSPTGDLLAVGDNEGLLFIYDQNFNLVKKVDTGLRSITGIGWHPTKRVVTYVSGKIGNYDLDTEELQVWKSRPEDMLLLSVDWHPSGKFFAISDYGDNYQNYPAQVQFHQPDGTLIKAMQGSKAEYRNIQWTQDGSQLATTSDAFRLWNKEGELISEQAFENLLWGLDYDHQNAEWIVTDIAGQVHRLTQDGERVLESVRPFGRD